MKMKRTNIFSAEDHFIFRNNICKNKNNFFNYISDELAKVNNEKSLDFRCKDLPEKHWFEIQLSIKQSAFQEIFSGSDHSR
jgi:hypothetical protein